MAAISVERHGIGRDRYRGATSSEPTDAGSLNTEDGRGLAFPSADYRSIFATVSVGFDRAPDQPHNQSAFSSPLMEARAAGVEG